MRLWECNDAVIKCYFAAWKYFLCGSTIHSYADEKRSLFYRSSNRMTRILTKDTGASVSSMSIINLPSLTSPAEKWGVNCPVVWNQRVLMMRLPAGMCNFIMFAAMPVQPQRGWAPHCRRCCTAEILLENLLCHDFIQNGSKCFNTKSSEATLCAARANSNSFDGIGIYICNIYVISIVFA